MSKDDSANKATKTDGVLNLTIANMCDLMKIPLGKILCDHGPYAPYGMCDFEYRITLPQSKKIMKAQDGEEVGEYKLTDMHLEYEIIESEGLAERVRGEYNIGRSLGYDYTTLLNLDNLEAICIEVLKPSSPSFIVGTIYRLPGAFVDSFSNIEQLVKLIDDKNKEFYLLGDLNANMLDNSNNTTKHLNAIMELYQLTQTISSPTRVTMTSSSLLDVCITPTPEKLVTSRVVPIAISDHYLILIVKLIFILIKSATRKLKFEVSNISMLKIS